MQRYKDDNFNKEIEEIYNTYCEIVKVGDSKFIQIKSNRNCKRNI